MFFKERKNINNSYFLVYYITSGLSYKIATNATAAQFFYCVIHFWMFLEVELLFAP